MSYLQVFNKYEAIETKFQLFEQDIQGFRFWDYLRVPIWNKILQGIGTFAKPHRLTPTGRNYILKRRTQLLKSLVFYNPFLAKQYDYLFIASSRRKLDSNGLYIELYCDPVIEFLGEENCLLLERFNRSSYVSPRRTKNIAHLEVLKVLNRMNRAKYEASELTSVEMTLLKSLEEEICTEFKLRDFDLLADFDRRRKSHQLTYPSILKLLKRISPKAVFLICSYGNELYIEACNSAGIPSIELQHGILGPCHPGYSYPDIGLKKSFPDYFFSFGNYWEENSSLPLPKNRIFTVGFPFFSQEQEKFRKTIKKKTVLIVSQATIGVDLSQFAVDLISHLPDGWNIIYKLHPGDVQDWKIHYPWLLESNIQVIHDESPPLYQLMAEATILVGVYSTALIEGLALNCHTVVVQLPGFEYMQSLIDSGRVSLIRRPEELVFDGVAAGNHTSDYYFADHWEENFLESMRQIDFT